MKKVVVFVVTMVLALSLSACGGADDTVRLGTIGPLTGDYSLYGTSVRDGALLAVEEINAAGGVLEKDLELFSYDSKGDPVEGVNAYNRLRDENEIHALIGGTFSGVTLAVKDLAVEDGMPVFTPTATHPDVTVDADNVFRACYMDSFQGSAVARFAKETLEVTKVAILYNRDDAYSEGLALAFKEEWGTVGLVSEETFGGTDDDYSAQLDKIAASGAEAVFLPGYVAEVGAILTQASNKGLDVPFLGGDGWDSIEVDYADVAEGNYFGNHYAKTDEAQVVQDFVANYKERFGKAPDALAALAYDAVYALVSAIEDANSLEAEDIVAALSNLNYENAVTGTITFDENGDPIKAVTMIQVKDGEHVVVGKVSQE